MRTPPVTWADMVDDPRKGGMRILENQIADRDEEIKRLRAALEEIRDKLMHIDDPLSAIEDALVPLDHALMSRQ